MTNYQAILTSKGPVDIGAFSSIDAAKVFALQQYGADVADVVEAPYSITVNHAELDPVWFVVGIVGLLLLFAGNKKRKRRKHVH